MTTDTQSPTPQPESISFSNGRSATVLVVKPTAEGADVLQWLKLAAPERLIVLVGSAAAMDPRLQNRVCELLNRGVAHAAAELPNTLILDGGTKAGVMELMGQAVAARDYRTTLLGVAPADKVSYPNHTTTSGDSAELDPNHTHFVLADSNEWGGETGLMFHLADALVKGSNTVSPSADANASAGTETASGPIPVVTLLVQGNPHGVAVQEVLASVRRGWPLIVIESRGWWEKLLAHLPHKLSNNELADLIAETALRKQRCDKRRARSFWRLCSYLPVLRRLTTLDITNAALAEIVGDGKITIFRTGEEAGDLYALLKQRLSNPREDDVLIQAWRRFAEYDLNSIRHQKISLLLRNIPLILGVLSTALVLLYSAANMELTPDEAKLPWAVTYQALMAGLKWDQHPWVNGSLRFAIILLPILTSLFLAIETQFKAGSKYILLREAAEAIKRGIYSFRALADPGPGSPDADRLPDTEAKLAAYIERIGQRLLASDVKETGLRPYEAVVPPPMYAASETDGISKLNPQQYINIRIGDQVRFYQRRTNQMEQRLRKLQIWTLTLGALGALLAAIGAQYWLPLTAALVTALTAYLQYQQLEPILIKYNFARLGLENRCAWWRGLSAEEKKAPAQIRTLVRETEAILEGENNGWVQYLTEALKQPSTTGGTTGKQDAGSPEAKRGSPKQSEDSTKANEGSAKPNETPPKPADGSPKQEESSAKSDESLSKPAEASAKVQDPSPPSTNGQGKETIPTLPAGVMAPQGGEGVNQPSKA